MRFNTDYFMYTRRSLSLHTVKIWNSSYLLLFQGITKSNTPKETSVCLCVVLNDHYTPYNTQTIKPMMGEVHYTSLPLCTGTLNVHPCFYKTFRQPPHVNEVYSINQLTTTCKQQAMHSHPCSPARCLLLPSSSIKIYEN